jgi:hypothetical protein
MKANVYRLNQIEDVPELPGIYAWYVLPKMHTQPQVYHEIFKQKTLHSLVKGNLQDNYEGRLTAKPYIFEDIQDPALLIEAIRQFSPPVYVGIAINLQRRLRTHVKTLNEFVYSSQETETFELSDLEVDSERESKYFACRVGSVIRNIKRDVDINSFLIKVIEMDESYSKAKLFEVEKFLNRTFIPYYGRK